MDLSPLVTHHFALDDIESAFEVFSQQRDGVMKVALHPTLPTARQIGEAAGGVAVRSR